MASRKEKELAYLKKLFENHKGDWLDWEGVEKYRCLAKQLTNNDLQLIGERRKLCYQMMEEYGVTELEATNIINGYHAADYVTKYHRIRYQIPLKTDDNVKKTLEEDDDNIWE